MIISFIGNGNVAQILIDEFLKKKHFIKEIYAPNYEKLQEFTSLRAIKPLENIKDLDLEIDLLIIAVKDNAIEKLIDQIPKGSFCIAHTSGTISMDIFKNNGFDKYGVFYPLFSFIKEKPNDLKKIPILIESSDKKALNQLSILAQCISDNRIEVNSEDRKKYHLAGVMINNFTNHFWAMTQDYLRNENLDFEYLKPILKQTSENAILSENLFELQTGPAKRDDQAIIETHLEMLKSNLPFQELYQKMTELILDQHRNSDK